MTTSNRYEFFDDMSFEHALKTVCEAHNFDHGSMSWEEKEEVEEFVLKVAKKFGYRFNRWENFFYRR